MKRLLIVFLAVICGPVFTAQLEYDQASSIELARSFIDRLQHPQPITYEEEKAYFGEMTLYSCVLLSQFGYIDDAGRWSQDKPKYSLLGELIRLNASDYYLDGEKNEYFFASIPKMKINGKLDDGHLYASIAYLQERSSCSFLLDFKAIIITYRIPQKRLDFPILVNGKSLATLLGFRLNEDKRIVLDKKAFLTLKNHLSKLTN